MRLLHSFTIFKKAPNIEPKKFNTIKTLNYFTHTHKIIIINK